MNYGFKLADVNCPTAMTPETWEVVQQHLKEKPIASQRKYWGEELLLEKSTNGAVVKRIDMNPGTQSSMEYHLTKDEIYYVAHGELRVGVRTDRAVNSVITVLAGEQLRIPPGLMHMRMAVSDVVIVEWASSDNPADTHLVHDGRTYQFREGPQ